MRFRTVVKRIVIYFLLIVFAFVLQTCVFPVLGFLVTAPNLLLIITFSYGFIYGTFTGLVCGIFAGFMMDVFYCEPFGLFIILYTYLGFFSGLFSGSYRNDSIFLPVTLCFSCDLMYNAAMIVYKFLTQGSVNLEYIAVHIVLPEMFFTLVITLIFYQALLSTNRKLDKIDDLRGQNLA